MVFPNSSCNLRKVVIERMTRQKQAVVTALKQSERSLLPQEIQMFAQQSVPQLNLSTVYRQLKTLLQEGRIQKVTLPGQAPRFELPSSHFVKGSEVSVENRLGHHPHFHCTDCNGVFPLHGCPDGIDRLVPQGFELQTYHLSLEGRCASCVNPYSSTQNDLRQAS
jgi:Fur family transcriptional regulator, ferric uptake regulator